MQITDFLLITPFDLLTINPILFDTAEPWGLFFQDNATPQMEGLEELHNNIMFYLAIILFAVSWIIVSIILNYNAKMSKYINHGTLVELIWTITPALILILIAFPSFKLLYLMDEVIDPSLVIYGEGHQWYWSYQYPDFTNNDEEYVEYNSYIIPESDLEIGQLRMLEVDNRVIIPELTHTRFVVAGVDVIHSFICPLLFIILFAVIWVIVYLILNSLKNTYYSKQRSTTRSLQKSKYNRPKGKKYGLLPTSRPFSSSTKKKMPEPMLATAVASTVAPLDPYSIIAGLIIATIASVILSPMALDEILLVYESDAAEELFPFVLDQFITKLKHLDDTLLTYVSQPVWLNLSAEDQIKILEKFSELETSYEGLIAILSDIPQENLEETFRRLSTFSFSFDQSDDPSRIMEHFFFPLRQQRDYWILLINPNA